MSTTGKKCPDTRVALTDWMFVLAKPLRGTARGSLHVVSWHRPAAALCDVEVVDVAPTGRGDDTQWFTTTVDAQGPAFRAGHAQVAAATQATCRRCRSILRCLPVREFPLVVQHTVALADNDRIDAERAEAARLAKRLRARLAAFDADQRTAAAELAESYRQAADLLAAAPVPAVPARTTWAAAGRPETLVWFGRDIDPGKPLLVTVNEYGNRLYDARTGQQVAHYGSDCPQWYAPAPAAPAGELPTAAPSPVVIVPCGSRKRPGRVRAAEKYIGPYARSARLAGEAVAERTGARIITLSARYGLLDDDDLVDDYDLTMGDVGSVTAGRIAEQAARLGITDSLVTVIAGKAYADVVSAVWPHAVRALDGCTSYGNQRARMGHIARGDWSPPAPVGATAAPALFGAELVAPADVTLAAAGDLERGDVLAPGTFDAQHADPVLVIASARPVDQPDGRRRVSLIVRPLPFAGRSRHVIVWADAGVEVVGRDSGSGNDWIHPPAEDAEILHGPALSWPRLLTATELRAGDVCAPGAFGPWNRTDTITVVTDPTYCDTVAGVRSYDIGTRVNRPSGPGPVRHGALRADSYIAVLERPTAIEAPGPAAELAAAATTQPLTPMGEAEDQPVPQRELVPAAADCGAKSAGGDFRSRILCLVRHGDTLTGAAGLVDPVNLHDYDVVLINISAGKDSMAQLVAVVELARTQDYDLGRIIAVHCDLGRVEWAGTAELAEEHAHAMGVSFLRLANKVDLLEQVRQRKRNLVRKAGELRKAAEAALAAGNLDVARDLEAQSDKKAAAPAWFSSAARYCTKSQKTGEVEKLMTALAKLWREAGNTDRPVRILNTLGIRADESAARALKKPFGPDSATNTRRTVTRWLPIFDWSETQVWATIRASGLRVHGAYQIGMSRLSCALCVLGSRQDLVTAARANRDLVDEYAVVEDDVEATFQNATSIRQIAAEADRLGPLELPAPASIDV
ncbi:3'-phosphoadenosine 5'-phosphosulfate sulfotransferase (PAPS reductase)/FAD synthetase [Krasilnikovia cinnamomea]|uniref:3'-phosphoadenosine 5'-phosphosulfate sulfotransferase (PAPS reductase)/FAD synthetase n=1 Tax=Krasilnikovia cinnamomea TaxID=349313 RepID=A0A4Q7Z801_9ACTN|nr:DUF6884 domain-containing protein [Krasilnikovia cinnamomea]RZU46568.1 3'-phosphoadenosine 5'-phosphosulfate sulfotransferase (PAPS reductase)/FAD synthetase [Krasilnikovia cinnamomea]